MLFIIFPPAPPIPITEILVINCLLLQAFLDEVSFLAPYFRIPFGIGFNLGLSFFL